jgi:hypothetical protein
MATHSGGCLCGAFRYEVDGAPLSSSVCHCRSCRLGSGAPSVGWLVVEHERFRVLSGELQTIRSSPPVTRGFCPRCGTSLTYVHDDSPAWVEFTTATLDRPDAFPPTHEIWLSEKIAWMPADPALRHFARETEDASLRAFPQTPDRRKP